MDNLYVKRFIGIVFICMVISGIFRHLMGIYMGEYSYYNIALLSLLSLVSTFFHHFIDYYLEKNNIDFSMDYKFIIHFSLFFTLCFIYFILKK